MDLKMDISRLLEQKGLVVEHPPVDEIIKRAKERERIKILYGETYDEYGETIDSMKHYFFVANLSDVLEKHGIKTEPTILIADIAVCRNEPEELHEKIMQLGKKRAKFVERINKIYNTKLKVVLMSEFINSKDFQKRVSEVRKLCLASPILRKKIEKTVPADKLEIEEKKGFQYSLEEIATILDVDIKIGPPREKLYDELAIIISKYLGTKKLLPIYLTPSYPLGVGFDYFLANEEIEKYGVTAYKAGSKGMQKHRIIIGKTNYKKAKNLIENSFVSKNPELPNPVLDIAIIAEMARQRLSGIFEPIKLYHEFYNKKNEREFKEKTILNLNKYVLSKLK